VSETRPMEAREREREREINGEVLDDNTATRSIQRHLK
jgi:hypothetical protein